MSGGTVTCTYTNTRTKNKVELVKEWVNSKDGDTADLKITGGIVDPTRAPQPPPTARRSTPTLTQVKPSRSPRI